MASHHANYVLAGELMSSLVAEALDKRPCELNE